MSYDFLKPVLGDELYSQFDEKMAAAEGIVLANVHDGSFIPKAKFDEVNNSNKGYRTQIDDLNARLNTLSENAKDNEALRGEITQLRQSIADKDKERDALRREYQIRDVARTFKARNVDVVMKMIDNSKITENNGQLYGVNEQFEAIKKSDPYLFDDDQPASGGIDPHQEPNGAKAGSNDSFNQMIRRATGR